MKRHLRATHAIWAVPVFAAVSVGWIRHAVLPRRPKDAETPRPSRVRDATAKPLPTGAGLTLVVNPGSGPALVSAPTEQLRHELPDSTILELGEGDDLADLLRDSGAVAVGAAGGDGTLAAAAHVAIERDALFVAVPAGTLNHFARDLGLTGADDAIRAVQQGCAASVDVGMAGDRMFLNTLSFGGYTAVVDARERYESKIGKWPALVVALVTELPRMEPLHLTIDGRTLRVWIAWVGNNHYSPTGLAPAWREAMDDGLLDIRIATGAKAFSRIRFTAAALTGRLRDCSVYEEWTAASLEVESAEGPLRLAADGETFDGPSRVSVSKQPKALRVALPCPD